MSTGPSHLVEEIRYYVLGRCAGALSEWEGVSNSRGRFTRLIGFLGIKQWPLAT